MKIPDGPPSDPERYRRQAAAFIKPAIKPEALSTVADDKREAVLQKTCEQELHRRDIAYLHISFRAREKAGWPDLVFALHGRPIAIELKSAAGTLSDDQTAMLKRMEFNGWEVYVMRAFREFYYLLEGQAVEQWEAL